MDFFKSKNKLSILQRKQETFLYELVMEEIANNECQKGIWGQAIVKSNGDEKKAEAEYIKLRVESLKDELEFQKQEKIEKATLQAEIERTAEEEKKKQNKKDMKKYYIDIKNRVNPVGLFSVFFAILVFLSIVLTNSL